MIDDLLKENAPRVLGRLVRRYGDFDTAEDAVQEALLAAAQQWPVDGVPAVPYRWLYTVASRRLIELWRNESSRRRRELTRGTAGRPNRTESDTRHRQLDRSTMTH